MFALPANVAAFTAPALPGFSMPQIKPFNTLSVLDDAKEKAKQLEASAKKEFSKAESAVKAKVPESAGGNKIELYSGKFYAVSALGGIVACGATHTLVTPLDLVKCRRQVDKTLYSGNVDGWKKIYAADGFRGLYTGWTPTALGYSMQGACKYGFYEFFKKYYSDLAGPTNAKKYKDAIYLAGSASAEFIADVALVPMEAVKVRIQTSTNPVFARGISDGVSKFVAAEGAGGLFKSLPSLWSRQIPYTMMKFWSFEATVAKIYASLGKPKQSYNKLQQLGVSFVGGYIAGVFCAIVSHPADTMVSKLNATSKTGVKPTVGGIYSEIGFGGLWAGLGTRIVMIGTLTALQWLIYDSFKTAFGLPTTGAAEPEKPAAGAIASKLH